MRMTSAQSRRYFLQAPVARLATVSAAGVPHLVPVTFAVIDVDHAQASLTSLGAGDDARDLIVFAVDHKPKSTTALRRLENIAANPRVAFLVDHYDEDWERLWWVRADTTAAIITGPTRLRGIDALRTKYRQYERYPPQGVVVAAAVATWSGWRSAPDGAA